MADSMARRLRLLQDHWNGLSPFQKRLVVANIGYLLLLFIYLVVRQDNRVKYALVLAGVTLAATIPELTNKKDLALRLSLLCIPALAIALIQIASDRENDRTQRALSQQLEKVELSKFRDDVRAGEIRQQEEIKLDPRDTVKAIMDSNAGFVTRADMLALHVASREARLMLVPSLASQLPDASASSPRRRLESYKALAARAATMSSLTAQSRADISDIISLLEAEAAYRDLAAIFVNKVKPEYVKFRSQYASGQHTFDEMKSSLWIIYGRVRTLTGAYDVAGLNNHLGVLAIASGHSEEGLSRLYHGFELDREHLPIYESLGYYLWSINNDDNGAFRFAASGLTEADALRSTLNTEVRTLHTPPAPTKVAEWNTFIDGMTVRLKLQYAYFAALGVQNEQIARKARQYAQEIYNSDTHDAEYQDALGFVLMRLAVASSDLDTAKKLFDEAQGNLSGEQITPRLAAQHAKELADFRRTLKPATP